MYIHPPVIGSNPPAHPWEPDGSGIHWDGTNLLMWKKVEEPAGTHLVWAFDLTDLTITDGVAGENIEIIDALSATTATITSGSTVKDELATAFGTVEGEATLVYRAGEVFYIRQKAASPAQTFPVIASTGEELDHAHGLTSLSDVTPAASENAAQWAFGPESTN